MSPNCFCHKHQIFYTVPCLYSYPTFELWIFTQYKDTASTSYNIRKRGIAGRTHRCRCKFRCASNFTTSSCGFPATARLSCRSLRTADNAGLHFKVAKEVATEIAKKCRRRYSTVWRPAPWGTPANIHIYLTLLETTIYNLQTTLCRWQYGSIFIWFFTARCYAERGYATVCRLSVCLPVYPSVRYGDHTGWNTSKIISPPNSLRHLLTLTPTWAI